MLTREQLYYMLLLRKNEGNIFHDLPVEIFDQIIQATGNRAGNRDSASPIFDYNDYKIRHEHSEIAKALRHAAYARKEDVAALLGMLDKNQHLLLEAGNVMTPGGLYCIRVTIYEFLLGAGDPDLAAKVQPYFAKIPNGENERIRQYERYRPHIEGMLKQKPHDITPLIDILKQSSAADDNALLKKNMTHESVLRDAAIQFRKDFAPSVLIRPRMHFNYASLHNMRNKFYDEWESLYRASGDNYIKLRILWRLISFTMRRLPGVDRCMMAQGFYDAIEKNIPLERSYKLKDGPGDFPITVDDDSLHGLGFDLPCDNFGGAHDRNWWIDNEGERWLVFRLMSAKMTSLQNLVQSQTNRPNWLVLR